MLSQRAKAACSGTCAASYGDPLPPHTHPHTQQRVKAACSGTHASEALVLPFDVTGPPAALEAAAAAADAAFGGLGVDYLFHNAGAAAARALYAHWAAGLHGTRRTRRDTPEQYAVKRRAARSCCD